MQVKGLMPSFGGISRNPPPTGRAVGRSMVWHNFHYCSKIYYALGQFYQDFHVTENRRCTIAHSSYGTSPIMCFCLDITEQLIPLIPPGGCHCNMDVLEVSREMLQFYYVMQIINLLSKLVLNHLSSLFG